MFFSIFRAKPPRPAEHWKFEPLADITVGELALIISRTSLNQYIRFEPGYTPADPSIEPQIARHFVKAPPG